MLNGQAELPTVSDSVWDGLEKTGVRPGSGSLFVSGALAATATGVYSVELELDRGRGVSQWVDGVKTSPRTFTWRIVKPDLAGHVAFKGGELTREQSLNDVRVDSAPAGSKQEIVSTRYLSPGRCLVTNPNYVGSARPAFARTCRIDGAYRSFAARQGRTGSSFPSRSPMPRRTR